MTATDSVLVVDDDRDIVRGLQVRLRAAGFDVLTAHDGVSGLAAVREQHPSVVVLDLQMPRKDGLTVLSELRSTPEGHDLPVIVMSASIADMGRARAMGADGPRYVIEKPFEPAHLMDAIRAVTAVRPDALTCAGGVNDGRAATQDSHRG